MNQYRQNVGLPANVDTPADTGYAPANGASAPTNPGDSSQQSGLAPWQHAPHLCAPSTNHEWFGAHLEVDNGAMDGFFTTNDGYTDDCKNGPYPCAGQGSGNAAAHSSWGTPSSTAPLPNGLLTGERALYYYDSSDLPFYYALASSFAIGDEYHSSLQGPTWPNRDYLYMASSRGVTTNVHPQIPDWPGTDVLIFDELEKRHVSWKVYMDGGIPGLGTITDLFVKRWNITGSVKDNLQIHFHTTLDFYIDAAAGKLPQDAFVDPKLAFENDRLNNDEHPPGDIQDGQLFVSKIVHAVMNSPEWPTTAMFLTYDENGGEYDHVAPPAACAPNDSLDPGNPGTIPPDLRFPNDQQVGPADGFTQYGARVPFTVISPFVKQAGYVSHNVYDHTSIVRFIEAKFKIPALTGRDANADALFDFFDFSNPQNPPLLGIPSVLNYDPANPLNAVVDSSGQAPVDPNEKSYCNALINMP
jgi:phospholipase C